MSLINPLLLYGLGLAAIPVILHFLLRAKPKKLLFPALRLIQVRRRQNVRRMRLRHIWLLLLRIAVIMLIVLAVARPRLPAAEYAPSGRELLTLAAIVAVVLAAYWGTLHWWRKQRLANHVMASRRTFLRGGAGVAALLLFLLLVAWPYQKRVAAEITGPQPESARNVPVCAVLLFDTSLSMQYRTESRTRLDEAKSIAVRHLENLPPQSRVAVADSSTASPILFQADLSGARARIESLETSAVSHSLNERVRTALSLQEEDRRRVLEQQGSVADDARQDSFIREIYVLTDKARSAWDVDAATLLKAELERLPWASVYLIDVGVEQPMNVAVASLKLSRQSLPGGAPLIIDAAIEPTGIKKSDRTVELYVQNDKGTLVKQGQHTVQVDEGSGARVQFSIGELAGPVTQGEVRLISSDPLPADDIRFFTVEVRRAPKVLLVAPREGQAIYLREALAPTELVQQKRARYDVQFLTPAKLDTADLREYAAVCFISVPELSEATWKRVEAYVKAGGGVAMFLGTGQAADETPVTPLSYNSETAAAFLPAELIAHLKFVPPEYLDLHDLSHPLLKRFEDLGGAGELATAEVRRYWKVQPRQGAAVVASFSNAAGAPAIVERLHGEGRSILIATTVDMQGWSDLPLARWSFLAWADQMMQHLTRQGEPNFNYTAGDEVTVRVDPSQPIGRYLLRKPGLQQLPGDVPPGARYFILRDADQLGHYEVIGGDAKSTFATGFSVNPRPGESDFTPLDETDLEGLFGKKRYSVARSIDELDRLVDFGRIGVEVFPLVLLLAIIAFCGEHIAANRFYESEQGVERDKGIGSRE